MMRTVAVCSHSDGMEDEDSPPELLDPAIVEAVHNRDGHKCILCGSKDMIVSHRLVGEHGLGVDPIYWLIGQKVVPDTYRSHELSNIMTLCEPHAYAYDEAVWRFVPSEGLLQEMKDKGHSDLQTGFNSSLLGNDQTADASSLDVSHATSDTSQEQAVFDLVIFRPQHMPMQNIPWAAGSDKVAIAAAAFEQGDCPRVLHAFRTLPLNPYVALAATFPVIGAAYLPLPDEAIRNVERGFDEIREAWNAMAPKAIAGMTFVSSVRE